MFDILFILRHILLQGIVLPVQLCTSLQDLLNLGVLDPEDLIGPLDLLPQELVLPLLVLGEFLLLFEMLFQVEEVLREFLDDMVIPLNLALMHL